VPNIKSAIKRVAVAERNNVRNRFWKSTMRSARTKVEDALDAKNPEDTSKALSLAFQTIDKAVSKGVLHKNAGNRRKSRLALRLAKLQPKK
jgi:small subunit ribosomal protein S20